MTREPSFPDFEPSAPVFIRTLAERYGDDTLVVHHGRRLTYLEAEEQSRLLARGLLASGVGKGTRVGLLFANSPEWIVTWLAVSRIGGLAVLLNTFHKPRELDWTLRHADVHTLLATTQFLHNDYVERLEDGIEDLAAHGPGPLHLPSHPYLRSIRLWGHHDRGWATHEPEALATLGASGPVDDALLEQVEREVRPADAMVVVYSSGSTAEPKAAVHTHGALLRHAHNLWQFRDIDATDRIYTPMPLFWIGGLSFTMVAAMHAGACLLFEDRFDPPRTLEFLEQERATQVIGWPHMGKALEEDPTFTERDLSSVRSGTIYELVPPERRVPVARRPNSLGMTETCGPHTCEVNGSTLPEGKEGSFGRAVPGVEHKVVDPITGAELPPGELGEICVRGYNVLQGMYKREREDVFDADGWYHTGDGGWFDEDGHLFFRGRMGNVIKSAGYLIAPREIELVLEEMPDVRHAFVVGLPHPVRDEDVAAGIVLSAGYGTDAETFRTRLRESLSTYKVPRYIAVFDDDRELPWLDSGKIDLRGVALLLQRTFAHRD